MKFTVNLKVPQNPDRPPIEDEEQAMFDQAIAFFQAGSRCEADFRLSPNITNSLSAPSAVCYVFSIEIYLKLLLKISNRSVPNEHSVVALFDALPPEIRGEIIKKSQILESEFRKQIELFSDVFIEWRYLYEQNSALVSLSNLAWIGQLLHNTIRSIKPSLKVTFENRFALPENYTY